MSKNLHLITITKFITYFDKKYLAIFQFSFFLNFQHTTKKALKVLSHLPEQELQKVFCAERRKVVYFLKTLLAGMFKMSFSYLKLF